MKSPQVAVLLKYEGVIPRIALDKILSSASVVNKYA